LFSPKSSEKLSTFGSLLRAAPTA